MGYSVTARYECDNCGTIEVTDGSRPEGWGGHLPSATDGIYSTIATYTMGSNPLTDPTYCRECISAARTAIQLALAARKKGPHLNQK